MNLMLSHGCVVLLQEDGHIGGAAGLGSDAFNFVLGIIVAIESDS